jgi:outer membrane murein-binding lipoprotein Lpp
VLGRRLDRIPIAAALIIGSLALAGCGSSTEPGAQTFLREHGSEARRAAALVRDLAAAVRALPGRPSSAQLEALGLDGHRAHRALLAASNWTQAENGEEEGVSQAEKEIHEGAEALLNAATDIHLFALRQRPRSLAAYRRELAAGREYWDQGIGELWFVAKQAGPPRI